MTGLLTISDFVVPLVVFFFIRRYSLVACFWFGETDSRRIILKLCKREVPNFSLVYKSDRTTGHSSLSLSPSPVLGYPLPAWSSVSLLVHLCAILDGERSHLQQLASTQEWARANKCDYYIIHTYSTYGYKIVLKDGGGSFFSSDQVVDRETEQDGYQFPPPASAPSFTCNRDYYKSWWAWSSWDWYIQRRLPTRVCVWCRHLCLPGPFGFFAIYYIHSPVSLVIF